MLYWAIAWGSIRTGAWWAFMPPTIMLSIVSFSLLLMPGPLDVAVPAEVQPSASTAA